MNEAKEIFALIVILPAGLWAIYASWKNKGSFFNSMKASIFVSIFGRTGARIFYGVLGVFLVCLWGKIFYDFMMS